MIDASTTARLSALAARCRELAETATDPEAADALRRTAADLESLMAVIEGGIGAEGQQPGDPERLD